MHTSITGQLLVLARDRCDRWSVEFVWAQKHDLVVVNRTDTCRGHVITLRWLWGVGFPPEATPINKSRVGRQPIVSMTLAHRILMLVKGHQS